MNLMIWRWDRCGYRSQVYLKTTTEGWLVLKKLNDSIENPEHRPLQYAEIKKTPTGFYKISFDDIKWYEGTYAEVDNFMNGLDKLEEQDIPYSFIRIGEDTVDIEHKKNWTEDMPDEISSFEPVTDVNDDDGSSYEDVKDEERSWKIMDYNIYETIIILNPKIKDPKKQFKELQEMYKKFSHAHKKKVGYKDLGEKKLAYKIKECETGYYLQFQWAGTLDEVVETERQLRINDAVIKFIIVKLDEDDYDLPDLDEASEQNHPVKPDALDVLLGLAEYKKEVK